MFIRDEEQQSLPAFQEAVRWSAIYWNDEVADSWELSEQGDLEGSTLRHRQILDGDLRTGGEIRCRKKS